MLPLLQSAEIARPAPAAGAGVRAARGPAGERHQRRLLLLQLGVHDGRTRQGRRAVRQPGRWLCQFRRVRSCHSPGQQLWPPLPGAAQHVHRLPLPRAARLLHHLYRKSILK